MATKEVSSEIRSSDRNTCGVVYLSRIPTRMNVKLIREYFSQFGSVGRIYLQPSSSEKSKDRLKRRMARSFSEGWVEFTDDSVAHMVAQTLNNQAVGGRHRHPWAEDIWNIKYLDGFLWTHLNERMAYEKAVKTKRLRLEVGQAKREAQSFASNLEFSQRLKRKPTSTDIEASSRRPWTFNQKLPDEEARTTNHNRAGGDKKRNNFPKSVGDSKDFLQTIFTAGKVN